jgi:hypothetical protein
MAAIVKMIATTTSSSIIEKPFILQRINVSRSKFDLSSQLATRSPIEMTFVLVFLKLLNEDGPGSIPTISLKGRGLWREPQLLRRVP